MTGDRGARRLSARAAAVSRTVVLVLVAVAGACASGSGGSAEGRADGSAAEAPAPGGAAAEEPATIYALGVPLNAVPEEGKCRIWRPGVHFTRQSGSGSCERLSRTVPEGAWLLRRAKATPERVELVVYGADGPSLVRVFSVEDGRLIRERMPR